MIMDARTCGVGFAQLGGGHKGDEPDNSCHKAFLSKGFLERSLLKAS